MTYSAWSSVDTPCLLDRECEKMGIKDWRMRIVVYANMWRQFSDPLTTEIGAVCYVSSYACSYLIGPLTEKKYIFYSHCLRTFQQYTIHLYADKGTTFAICDSYAAFLEKMNALATELTHQELFK